MILPQKRPGRVHTADGIGQTVFCRLKQGGTSAIIQPYTAIRIKERNGMKRNILIFLAAGALLCAGCGAQTGNAGSSAGGSAAESQNIVAESAAAEEGTAHAGLLPDANGTEQAQEAAPGTAYEELPTVYQDILQDVAAILVSGESNPGINGNAGILETLAQLGTEQSLQSVAWAAPDTDGSGTQELLILDGDDCILSMYTQDRDAAAAVLESTARSRYYLLEDGRIYYEGSSGAAYTIYAFYRLDGSTLAVQDYYFTEYADENDPDSWGWYHNTTGESDVSVSERVDESIEGDQTALMEAYRSETASLERNSFADLAK